MATETVGRQEVLVGGGATRAASRRAKLRRVLRPRWLLAAGILAVASAVAAVALSAKAVLPAQVYAAWRAAPAHPVRTVSAGVRTCGRSSPVGVSDVRGPFVSSAYAEGPAAAFCISGPNGISALERVNASREVGSTHIQTFVFQAKGAAFRSGLVALYGRVGDHVSSVRIQRADGTPIVASVRNGWYLVWWPSTVNVRAIQVEAEGQRQAYAIPASANSRALSCSSTLGGAKPQPSNGPVVALRHPMCVESGYAPARRMR